MTVRSVTLTDRAAAIVDASVSSGRFRNASEVMDEALLLLEQREHEDALRLDRLKDAVAVGREDVRQGRTVQIQPGGEPAYLASLGKSGVRQA